MRVKLETVETDTWRKIFFFNSKFKKKLIKKSNKLIHKHVLLTANYECAETLSHPLKM